MDNTKDYESFNSGSNPDGPIYEIDYVGQCSYFNCIVCTELLSLEYPKDFRDAKRMYRELAKEHKH